MFILIDENIQGHYLDYMAHKCCMKNLQHNIDNNLLHMLIVNILNMHVLGTYSIYRIFQLRDSYMSWRQQMHSIVECSRIFGVLEYLCNFNRLWDG